MPEINMEKFSSREELCEAIDKTLLEFFDILTDLYQQQALLGQAMKSGFLNLSRARYSMGVKSVDISQIDETKMQALVRVGVKTTEDFDCHTDVFSLIDSESSDLGKETCDQSVNTEKVADQSGLRKRTVKSGGNGENKNESVKSLHIEDLNLGDTEDNEIEKPENQRKKSFDPLKCFGVLLPGALKQSQSEFKKSTELAVTVGNLQTKLEICRKNYKKLLMLKQKDFS